ncbi:MAG: hypothetical protein F6K30_16160 [Cyanothece sp. SIO2G6]|nr:hypothetical protein [Cyanothece sp. SIO2G6]
MKRYQVLAGLGVAIALGVTIVQAQDSDTIRDIEPVFVEAVRTGQFRTLLTPYIHPQLRDDADSYWLFEADAAPADSTIASTVRPVNADELARFAQYYQDYVEPTHVIEVEVRPPQPTNGITASTMPLFVRQTPQGSYIVFGTRFRDEAQIEDSLATQQFLYFQDTTGPWLYHWKLQFELGSPFRYTIQLRDTQSDIVLETFLIGEPGDFDENHWEIQFLLQPEDSPTVYQPLLQGGLSLPYSYHIGDRALAGATDLPLDSVTQFTPLSDLSFERDRLLLAQMSGRKDGEEQTLVIEVLRTLINN